MPISRNQSRAVRRTTAGYPRPARANNPYAGTASFSFFADSISFCAMCAGTSS